MFSAVNSLVENLKNLFLLFFSTIGQSPLVIFFNYSIKGSSLALCIVTDATLQYHLTVQSDSKPGQSRHNLQTLTND